MWWIAITYDAPQCVYHFEISILIYYAYNLTGYSGANSIEQNL